MWAEWACVSRVRVGCFASAVEFCSDQTQRGVSFALLLVLCSAALCWALLCSGVPVALRQSLRPPLESARLDQPSGTEMDQSGERTTRRADEKCAVRATPIQNSALAT